MSHINEPKGIDFLIKSPPLTDDERMEISELIKKTKKRKRTKEKKNCEEKKT